MKQLSYYVFFLAAYLSWSAAFAAGPAVERDASTASGVEARLQVLEQRRAEAILHRDIPALQTLMDRYYRHVESRGRVRSKTELLRALGRDEFRFQQYENETTEIQLLGGGRTAVIAGVFRSRQEGAKPFRGRYVRIWVLEPDGWKNTFHQATEIRLAPDNCGCK